MPAYEMALPIGATNVELVSRGKSYAIDTSEMCFTRVGQNGSLIILPIFGGDEFEGDILEGHWKKFWSTDMDADQAFTAIIDGSGTLEIEGEADVAGTIGYGVIHSNQVIPMVDGLEIQVSMQVPIDDTGVTADRDLWLSFFLNQLAPDASTAFNNNDTLRVDITVTEAGLLLGIVSVVGGSGAILASGDNYTMDGTYGTGDLEGVIWRITFHDGIPGETGVKAEKHIHVYLRQSDTIVNAEEAIEYEVTGSPFDISNLDFSIAYPTLMVGSENTSYFDSGNEAKSTYVRVDYPNLRLKYDVTDANRLLNEVALWDGDPNSGGIKVYDIDHSFSNDLFLQNGLLRDVIKDGQLNEHSLWGYMSTQYRRLVGGYRFYLRDDATHLSYHWFEKILYLSPEKITLQVKSTDSSTNDDDLFVRWTLTMKRGEWMIEIVPLEIYPIQEAYWNCYNVGNEGRFGWVGNKELDCISDEDININATNTELPDNLMVALDNAGSTGQGFAVFAAKKFPVGTDSRFYLFDGGAFYYQNVSPTDPEAHVLYTGYGYFPLYANLFEEAEDATTTGALATDALASPLAGSNNCVELDAQNEYVRYDVTAGTHLPEGRYLAIFRAKDTNQIADDVWFWVINSTDSSYRDEVQGTEVFTLTASFAYYSLVFDITAEDVDGTNNIRIRVEKGQADANTITVDYFLIVPIGDGESFPQDLAHNAMRTVKQERRLYLR